MTQPCRQTGGEGGEEMLQVPKQRVPWRRSYWGTLFPQMPGRTTVDQTSTCSPWGTPCHSKWRCSEGSCSLCRGAYTKSGLSWRPAAHEGDSRCSKSRTTASMWEGHSCSTSWRTVYWGVPCQVSHAREGKECEEEGAAERSCYVLSVASIPHPSVLLPGRGSWAWEGRGEVGRCFSCNLFFFFVNSLL